MKYFKRIFIMYFYRENKILNNNIKVFCSLRSKLKMNQSFTLIEVSGFQIT